MRLQRLPSLPALNPGAVDMAEWVAMLSASRFFQTLLVWPSHNVLQFSFTTEASLLSFCHLTVLMPGHLPDLPARPSSAALSFHSLCLRGGWSRVLVCEPGCPCVCVCAHTHVHMCTFVLVFRRGCREQDNDHRGRIWPRLPRTHESG